MVPTPASPTEPNRVVLRSSDTCRLSSNLHQGSGDAGDQKTSCNWYDWNTSLLAEISRAERCLEVCIGGQRMDWLIECLQDDRNGAFKVAIYREVEVCRMDGLHCLVTRSVIPDAAIFIPSGGFRSILGSSGRGWSIDRWISWQLPCRPRLNTEEEKRRSYCRFF